MLKILQIILLLSASFIANAQTTLILQPGPDDGKDAFLRSLDPDVNRANHPDISAQAGTNGGNEVIVRGIFDFDISSIPQGSTIISADLTLYSYNSASNGTHLGQNCAVISKVTEAWDENTVTWNNQPIVSVENQIKLVETKNEIQDFIGIDVTQLIKDKFQDPANNQGFLFYLETETIFRKMLFASSDNENTALRPKLSITYVESEENLVCDRFQPGEEGKDAYLRFLDPDVNRANHPYVFLHAGTNGGVANFVRSIVDFDLTSIPDDAEVVYADLSLQTFDDPAVSHLTISGSNGATISQVIEPWLEDQVTWNNQPATTNENQLTLEATSSVTQNFIGLDVTPMVKNMLLDPSIYQGFLFQLNNEDPFRTMLFASSDNENTSIRPILNVCYTSVSSVGEDLVAGFDFQLYPNPSSDFVVISTENTSGNTVHASITSSDGKELQAYTNIPSSKRIDISDFHAGVYYITVEMDGKSMTKSIIVQ